MRLRQASVVIIGALLLVLIFGLRPNAAAAGAPSSPRTFTVGFNYVTKYKNRLVNAQAAFNQLQQFLDKVHFIKNRQYSFLRDVVHYNFRPDDGYVNTPLGYGFGSCGAPSLLNKLVQQAVFRDSDGVEKPVFQTVMVWTWRGDPTYGKWGATIYYDPSGAETRDYIWKINPAYDGPEPTFEINFDIVKEAVQMTMTYGDESGGDGATEAVVPAVTKQPTEEATANPPKEATAAALAATDVPQVNAAPDVTKVAVVNTMPDSDNSERPSAEKSALILSQQLQALIRQNRFGVAIIPINEAAAAVTKEVMVNGDMQTYVASAFKGAVLLYFLENTDPSIWTSIPVKYWNVRKPEDVPEEFQTAWNQYKDLLYNVWTMEVWSENDSTGNVLAYVWKHNTRTGDQNDNPIIAFNNWLHDSVKADERTGLRSWFSGATNCTDCIDARYGNEAFSYRGKILVPNNTFSPRDLAKVYIHLATEGRKQGYYNTAAELMGLWRGPNAPSMLQWYFGRRLGMMLASKDGFVGPDDDFSDGYYISTDAGLLTFPDGKQFAVAYMAFDSGNLLDDAMLMTGKIIAPELQPKEKKR